MSDVILFCLCLWSLSGVFCEFMQVRKGDPVTLPMSLNEQQRKQGISWKFGAQGYLIAEITRGNSKVRIYEDQADGRFRDKLMLDNQTGSLTITNITTNHSGLYEVTNTSTNAKLKIFNVTVYDHQPGHITPEFIYLMIGCAAAGVIIIIALPICICICIRKNCRKKQNIYQHEICSGDDVYTGIK